MQTALFKKKIIFYSDTDTCGSVEKLIWQLNKNLDGDKYMTALVCPRFKQLDAWCREWQTAGFPVHRLAVVKGRDPRHSAQLKKIFRAEKPDLIHVHLRDPLACRYVFSTIKDKSAKIVATEHDPYPLSGLKNSIKKKHLKKTDHTITVSEANRDMMIKLYPTIKNRISTVPNGLDLDEFRTPLIRFSSQHRLLLRQKLFRAKPQDYVIVSVAALDERKGLNYLIEAFAGLAAEKDNVKLAIVGEGPERKKLEKLIKNLDLESRVSLTGGQNDIAKILNSAELFVLPSVREAFGLAAVEAMESGIPVIGSATGGIAEIIEHNKTGLLVEPGNAKALLESIKELMDNPPLGRKLTYVASHEVKKFGIMEMVKKTEKIYDYLLNQ